MLIALLSTTLAHAAACDAKALKAGFDEASPASAGAAFAELAECDPAQAKALAGTAFSKIIAGKGGNAAALAAIKLGSGAPVRDWIEKQASDEKPATLAFLGQECADPSVPAFFVESEKVMGKPFYDGRWFAALATCRDPSVQSLLATAVDRARADRGLYAGLLGAYARNLGKAAIPGIGERLGRETDTMVSIDLVKALPDAAGVGGVGGPQPDAVTLAVTTLSQVATKLPDKAVEAARTAFLALGSEVDSDGLAAVRYKNLLQGDGGLLYGVVGVEKAVCKKGDTRLEAHTAQVNGGARTWPDQVHVRVKPAAEAAFDLDLAENCKGTGTVEFLVPSEPFKDVAAYKAWSDKTLSQVQKDAGGVSVKVYNYDALNL